MAVIALTSLTGAPGVTATAVAWAMHSERSTLIVEADVTGGSPILAGIWQGTVSHTPSVLALASVDPIDYGQTIWKHAVQLPQRSDRWVLPAIGHGVQATSMRGVWSPLSVVLSQLSLQTGMDVLIDAGRLGVAGSAWPLIQDADVVLLLTDSTLPALNAVHLALPSLRAELDETGSHERLAVVAVLGQPLTSRLWARLRGEPVAGAGVRPYQRGNVAASVHPTKAIAALRHDPRAASVYSDGVASGGFVGRYVDDIARLIEASDAHIARYRSLLGLKENR